MEEKTLGQRIAVERKKLGLSQESLGEKVGVSRQAISKWESDAAVPELDNLRILSRLFGTSLDSLLGGEEAPPEQETRDIGADREEVPPAEEKKLPPDRQNIYLVGALCLAIILALVLVSTDRRLRTLTAQTAELENRVHSLTAQLEQMEGKLSRMAGTMTAPVVSKTEEELLAVYDLTMDLMDPKDPRRVTVRFYGVAKQWQEGKTGYLSVIREGQTVAREKCIDEKGVLMAEVTLDVANGYSFLFIQEDPLGIQEPQQLSVPKLENLADSLLIFAEVYPLKFTYKNEKLTLKDWGFRLEKPDQYRDLSWERIEWVLFRGDEEIARQNVIPEGKEDLYTWDRIEMSYMQVEFEQVPLPGDGGLYLKLYARLSNGLEILCPAKTWAVNRHGDLQMQD